MMFPQTAKQRRFAGAVFFCVLGACATPQSVEPERAEAESVLCERDGVSIRTDFSGAGQHGCAPRAEEFVLTVWPEAALMGRINPSPWYGFSVEGEAGNAVDIVLDYGSYEHRYAPWTRTGTGDWVRLSDNEVKTEDDGRIARLTLALPDGPLRVAGQPIFAEREVADFVADIEDRFAVERVTYGTSAQGRPLTAILAGPEDAKHLVVALTRQHPPELNGALAFNAFVETVLGDTGDPVRPNTRYVFFPMMNPDGVENGYWRHGMGGVDLNRDWFAVSQPEVETAQALIRKEAEGRTMFAFLDFHSTWRTLVYFHPFDTEGADSSYPEALKAAMDMEFDPKPDWISSHNDSKGTSKNWALTEFNTPGMTIELGDLVSEAEATRVGELTADVLVSALAGE